MDLRTFAGLFLLLFRNPPHHTFIDADCFACQARWVGPDGTAMDHLTDCAFMCSEDPEEAQFANCYLCFLETTGKADMSPRSDQGPLRRVVDEGTAYGFDRAASARQGYDGDPYSALKLECGHTII